MANTFVYWHLINAATIWTVSWSLWCNVNSAHFHLSHTCFLCAAFHTFPRSRRDRCTISFIDLLLVKQARRFGWHGGLLPTKQIGQVRTCVDLIAPNESLYCVGTVQTDQRTPQPSKTPFALRNRSPTDDDRSGYLLQAAAVYDSVVERSVCRCSRVWYGFPNESEAGRRNNPGGRCVPSRGANLERGISIFRF